MRRDLEVRVATLAERWAVLTRRLEGVDARLSSRGATEHAEAEQRRAALSGRARLPRGRATDRALTEVDAIHDRLRERRRRQSEGG